jgi:hypothetical protein
MEDKSLETLIKLAFNTRFPNECAVWQRHRKEIIQGFRRTLVDRQAAMHATIEENLENIRVKIQEAVIAEVLKAFS